MDGRRQNGSLLQRRRLVSRLKVYHTFREDQNLVTMGAKTMFSGVFSKWVARATFAARLLLGLIYVVFGLNGLFRFIPVPPMAPEAERLMVAFFQTGYFIEVVKLVEVLGGLMLVTGLFAPLGLVLLAPITVQIFLFHFFLTPGIVNWAPSAVMVWLHLVAAHRYRHLYLPIMSLRGKQ
jgi:uncharacterized membrane protein YphA (DoxX/SURF4 family)